MDRHLVVQSTSDKALVSRTLRLLEKRGLVELRAEGNTPRKRLTCLITPAGNVLHEQVIPLARRSQAEAIHVMTPEERVVVFRALKLWGGRRGFLKRYSDWAHPRGVRGLLTMAVCQVRK